MEEIFLSFLALGIEIAIFFVLLGISTFIYKQVRARLKLSSKWGEAIPEDELHTLKQVFYLIIMALAFAEVLYSFIVVDGIMYFAIFDLIFSLFLAMTLDKSTWEGKLILFLLVPFDSINFLFFDYTLFTVVDLIHILVFLYFIKVYYGKFREYTESNGLSFTIIILFIIIFVSFIVTQVVEGVNPLDSLVMVSNAFTSNGYSILGSSIAGKINAIVLVWGGYILSGVGTATLTAAILMRHFNHKFDELEELIKNNGLSNQNDDGDS